MARLHSCNVLQLENGSRHLWQFSAGSKFNLLREEVKAVNEPLPGNLVTKDWQALLKPTLNVACLPADKVFLRALQLPTADFAEMQSMVELQLEKVSPLPVAQIVWSFEVLPHSSSDMQTIVVIIVARQYVEEYLGQLEGAGYLADRLELPLIDLLHATKIDEDGVWIYPADASGEGPCLVAWWYGGVLQNISLVNLPAGEQRGPILQNQLVQIMWAGEMEGWITSTPKFHLMADEETARMWHSYLPPGYPVEVVPPPSATEIANRTARRAASEKARAPLLPPEYSARYKQRFVDRLWMRGLGAAVMAYILIVLGYFAWVQFEAFKLRSVESDIAELGPAYTNTVQIRERMRVLQEQMDLQFAGLDCYKSIAETMPAELTLDSLVFDRRKLTLSGTASGEQGVYDFNEKMRNSTVKNQPLFSKVLAPSIRKQGEQYFWNFPCELKRSDYE
jgi:hypothetical protein